MKICARFLRCVPLLMAGLLAMPVWGASASADKTVPAAKPGAINAGKKEEPMGKVEGIEVKYGGGYFGVELVGGTFKITFYDAKRKVIPAPVKRAALRWPVNYRPLDERAVLNISADGKSLTSSRVVKPPYVFKLFVTLLDDGVDENAGTETYVVDFRA